MAELAMFAVCESVIPGPGNVPHLVSPMLVIRPKFIPGNFSFGVCFSVSGIVVSQEHTVQFKITSPSGETVFDSGENVFPPALKQSTLPEEYQGFTMTTDIRNMVVSEEGAYTFEVICDGSAVGSKLLYAFRSE